MTELTHLRQVSACIDDMVHCRNLTELMAVGKRIDTEVKPEGRDREYLLEFFAAMKKELMEGTVGQG